MPRQLARPTVVCLFLALLAPAARAQEVPDALRGTTGPAILLPWLWTASNSRFQSPGITVTAEPQEIVSVAIQKRASSSLLKVGFAGGNLSFFCEGGEVTLNSQAVLSVVVDGQVFAEGLNYDADVGFRNQYPSISAILRNVSAGRHTISVRIATTDNPGEGGRLTYVTSIGHDPNTYEANLAVEEWAAPPR